MSTGRVFESKHGSVIVDLGRVAAIQELYRNYGMQKIPVGTVFHFAEGGELECRGVSYKDASEAFAQLIGD